MISQTDKVTRLVDVKKNRQTPNMSNDSNWVQTKPSKTWLIRPAASKCTVIISAMFCLFESRFWEGPLLARATETDEHIMVTSLGMFTTRTIRTEKDQELCSSDLIKGMRGGPYTPRGEIYVEIACQMRGEDRKIGGMIKNKSSMHSGNQKARQQVAIEVAKYQCKIRKTGHQNLRTSRRRHQDVRRNGTSSKDNKRHGQRITPSETEELMVSVQMDSVEMVGIVKDQVTEDRYHTAKKITLSADLVNVVHARQMQPFFTDTLELMEETDVLP